MLRLVTSINWAIGTLILGGTLMYALIGDKVISGNFRAAAETAVKSIAKAERDYYAQREKYVYFPAEKTALDKAMTALGIGAPPENFRFEAFADANNALVIRAITSTEALRAGWVPPLLYEYKIKSASETGSGNWVNL